MQYTPSELSKCLFFGPSQTSKKVDITIIIGRLNLERTCVPKLLLMRFHSIITSNISSEDAIRIYESLRAVSGKHGYELNRVGGSNGIRDAQSEDNFRMVINDVPSAFPKRGGAILICPSKLSYNCFYKKNRSPEDYDCHPIAKHVYSIP